MVNNFSRLKIKTVLSIIIFMIFFFNIVSVLAATPFTGFFNYIAYSYVNGVNDAPINTAEHFELCASSAFNFDSIKGDLRVTSDNQIVMCHDPGFTFNSEGRITSYNSSNMTDIHDLTYAQCMALQYARQFKGNYVSVCDFETYLSICARNHKTAFITIRNQYIPELLNTMMPIIYKYGMQNQCIVNSFTLNSLKLVKQYDSSIRLSWVIQNGRLNSAVVDNACNLGNCLLTLYNFPSIGYGGFDALALYENSIIYAQEKGIVLYAAIVDDASIIEQLKTYGISGAQINVRSNHINHNWDDGVVTQEPTCSSVGIKIYTCTICGTTMTEEIPAINHNWDDGVVTQEPTCSSAGIKTFTCTICGTTMTEEIPALERTSIATCKISGIKNKIYTSSKIEQEIRVSYNGIPLSSETDYSVFYRNNKQAGIATVTIKGKGAYKDSVVKTFEIKPQKTVVTAADIGRKKVKMFWKKAKSGTGYEIQYKLKGTEKFKSILIKNLKKTSKTIKNLKSGKVYQFRIRVYKRVGTNMIYSKWSKTKKVSIK